MNMLVRRQPIGSFLDDFFGDWLNYSAPVATRRTDAPAVARARLDVLDKGGHYAVKVDLPGVAKDDIKITLDGARVSIEADAKGESDVKDGERVLHTERYATSYARRFELPAEVAEDGAEAKFENGVLNLTLPKRAAAQSKQLTVK
jgi:HSP20 family protein